MNIYRNKKTGRLVKLFRVTPRMILGSWLETEDLYTGEVKKLPRSQETQLVLVAVR